MIAAIIQARMGSSRLPKKVMLNLAGKSVLWHVIDRLKSASRIDYILVATTTDKADNIIEQKCKEWDVPVFRGSNEDVLARFYHAVQCIQSHRGTVDYIVRITADCPVIDPIIVDSVVEDAVKGGYDYVSNVDPPTYPDGFDVEVIKREALEQAYHNSILASEREHVTLYIRKNEKFSKFNHKNSIDLSNLRLTLDTEEDFRLINEIFMALYRSGETFYLMNVIHFLEKRPDLLKINAKYLRNEGYEKSLEKDRIT